MAIDAVVVGVRFVEGEHKLTLEPRGRGTAAGQETLVITNPPDDPSQLGDFVGAELWGGSGYLMLGDAKIADREGYIPIRLVDGWRALLKAYHGGRANNRTE